MYGVINKSLRDMVCEQYGEPAWERILKRSGVADDSFLAMRSYDDSITYQLAQAAADELGIDLADALRAFGVHWVEHTLRKNYDTLVRASGSQLLEFLTNLNALHDRISLTFLDYQPPEFQVESRDDGLVKVLYISQRVGLTPFVEGLMVGLGHRFNERLEVVSVESQPVPEGEQSLLTLKLG